MVFPVATQAEAVSIHASSCVSSTSCESFCCSTSHSSHYSQSTRPISFYLLLQKKVKCCCRFSNWLLLSLFRSFQVRCVGMDVYAHAVQRSQAFHHR